MLNFFRSLTAIIALRQHSEFVTHSLMLEPYCRFNLVPNSTTTPILTPTDAIISFDVADGRGGRWRAKLMSDENHTASSLYLAECNSSGHVLFSRLRTFPTISVLNHTRYDYHGESRHNENNHHRHMFLSRHSSSQDENLADYARWVRINQKFIFSRAKNGQP